MSKQLKDAAERKPRFLPVDFRKSLDMFESPEELLDDDNQTKSLYARTDIMTSESSPPMTSEELLTQETGLVTGYLCVVLVVALVSNGALGCVIYSRRQLFSVSNYFVLNLACCQLGLCLLALPVSVASALQGRWVLGQGPWCRGQAFLLLAVMAALHFTLLAISLDRNFAILYSLRYPSVFTQRLGRGIIAGTWILGLVVGLPPLAGWGAFKFERHQFFCLIDWQADLAYSCLVLVLVFLLPLLVHLWSYISIFRAALRHTRRCRKVFPASPSPVVTASSSPSSSLPSSSCSSSPSSSSPSTSSTTTSSTPTSATDTKTSFPEGSVTIESTQVFPHSQTVSCIMTKCKAVKTIVLIALTYFVCWVLYVVVAVLKSWKVPVSPSVELSSMALLFLSCVLNPLVYGFMNRLTRFEIWKLWNRFRGGVCGHPLPSFPDTEDGLSSTWSTSLASSRTSSSVWVTSSQRQSRCHSTAGLCSVRGGAEMVTIPEEPEVEQDVVDVKNEDRKTTGVNEVGDVSEKRDTTKKIKGSGCTGDCH